MRPPTNSSRIVFKVAKDWYATFTWCRQQKTSCVGQAIKSNKHLHVTITQFVINKKHQESASKGSYWWFVNPLILIGMFTHLNKPCKVRKLPQSPNPLPVADRIRDGILCSRSPNASSTWEFNDCKTVLAICASKFYTWYLIISCKYTLCMCNTTVCANENIRIHLKNKLSPLTKDHYPAHWCQPAKRAFLSNFVTLQMCLKTQKVMHEQASERTEEADPFSSCR